MMQLLQLQQLYLKNLSKGLTNTKYIYYIKKKINQKIKRLVYQKDKIIY